MKDAEDAVERVLAGLRRAEAGPGLEGRVRGELRRQMAEGSVARAAAFHRGWRWAGIGLVCTAILLVAAISIDRAEKRSSATKSGEARDSDAQTSRASPASVKECKSPRFKPPLRRNSESTAEAVPPGKAVSGEASSGGKGPTNEAVSFPAPPLPLTEQERLLLRIAIHGGPEEVAMLDPAARAMQDAEETAVFLDFFGRPLSVEQTIQKVNQGESR